MSAFWLRISSLLSTLLVEKRPVMYAALLAIAGTSFWTITRYQTFDTEVFHMLPDGFESVQGLQRYNQEFSQSRQLSFGLIASAESQDFEEFTEFFRESLAKQSWLARSLQDSPLESPETLDDLYRVFVPILLSLPPDRFEASMNALSPEAIRLRLEGLHESFLSGSPKAEFELQMDPFGVVIPELAPIVQTARALGRGNSEAAQPSFSLVLAITNQESLDAKSCIQLMSEVENFRKSVLEEWQGSPMEIVVTGRAAYVAEISQSMERDIMKTSLVSILAVGILFFIGFRRLLPLLGIVGLLVVSCIVGLAMGAVVFPQLSVIAIAFCSILIGLGDDFSLLLLEHYRREVELHGRTHKEAIASAIFEAGPGILVVAGITSISFLSLLFSGSRGFAQLGFLIAAGVVACAVLMVGFLFLFVRPYRAKVSAVSSHGILARYVTNLHASPGRPIGLSILSFLFLSAAALSPFAPLQFDTRPRSLEPKNSRASMALAKITEAMKLDVDPVMVMVEGADLQETKDRWIALSRHLSAGVQEGRLKAFSDPLALLPSPREVENNLKTLQSIDLQASAQSFRQTLEGLGFVTHEFDRVFAMLTELERLSKAGSPQLSLRSQLAESSPLHFILDRFVGNSSHVVVGYVYPTHALTSVEDQKKLEQWVRKAGVPVILSGWSFTLMDLVPWARGELMIFGSAVLGLVVILMGLYYRRWDLWLIHLASLAFAVAGLITSLKVLGQQINLLNVLAFPLVMAIGVDYGLHVLSIAKTGADWPRRLDAALKPIGMSGITTVAGFGSLCLASNPALAGMGTISALGILWCLIATFVFTVPCMVAWVGVPPCIDPQPR